MAPDRGLAASRAMARYAYASRHASRMRLPSDDGRAGGRSDSVRSQAPCNFQTIAASRIGGVMSRKACSEGNLADGRGGWAGWPSC